MSHHHIILAFLLMSGPISGNAPGSDSNKNKDGKLEKFEVIFPNLYRYKGAANSYLLKSGNSAILIDAGSENIPEQLHGIGVTEVECILHTHYHRDQCLADIKLKNMGASIATGILECEKLEPRGMQPPYKLPVQFLVNGEVPDWGGRMAPFQKPGVDRILIDNQIFIWKNYQIHVINTPGHTEGSISYFVEVDGRRICFSGDLIMRGGYVHDLYSMEWNYLENPGIDSSIISLQKISQFNPDCILPSHGTIINDPDEDIRLMTIRLQKVQKLLQFERAGRWNWSGFVQISPHVIQDCGTTSQIIIASDGEALMFDCGADFTPKRLEEAKRMFGIKRIEIIIPSHWHYDHVDGILSIAKAEGAKIWVWEGLADHLEFPERFPTTCWTGKSIKADRLLSEGEEFNWGGYSFKVYQNPVHMEEQMGLSAFVDGLKFYFIADGTALNKESHIRSAIHAYNGISLATGLIKTAKSFYDADPYICVPAHSNGFATFDDTRDEFMTWAAETTDFIKALLPPAHPELGYDPYWATFYPAKIVIKPGDNAKISLRLKNSGLNKIFGKYRLKSYGNISFNNAVLEYILEPGEIKDIPFLLKGSATTSPGINIVTADIMIDNELFAEFPQGYVELERQ